MESKPFPIPTAKSHQWVVYLTARCNFSCDYCIQKGRIVPGQKRKPWARYDELSGEQWVKALNGLPVRPEHTLILTGGEPTIHRDFYYIATQLEGYRLDLTSNLSFDIEEFTRVFKNAGKTLYSSFHTYHPKWMKPQDFVERALRLRDAGVIEHPVFSMVDLDGFPHFRDAEHDANTAEAFEWAARQGLRMQRNEFRGNHMGVAFEHEARHHIDCTSGWVNFAPDGEVFNCQYHLEQGAHSFGKVTEMAGLQAMPEFGSFFRCADFGFCDSCHENSGRGAFRDAEGKIFRRTGHDARVYLRWMEPGAISALAQRMLDEGKLDEARHAVLAAVHREEEAGGAATADTWMDVGLTLWQTGDKHKAIAALLHYMELGGQDNQVVGALLQLGRETGREHLVREALAQHVSSERIEAVARVVTETFV